MNSKSTGGTLQQVLSKFDEAFGDALDIGLDQVRAGILPVELTLDQLPRKFDAGSRHYEVEYHPAATQGSSEIESLLVVVSDATARVEAARLEERQKEVLSLFERLMHDRRGVLTFLDDGSRIVKRIAAWKPGEDTIAAKRDIHTLKGNAAILGVTSIARLCHEMEDASAEGGSLAAADRTGLQREWAALRGRIDQLIDSEGTTIELEESDYEEILGAFAAESPRDVLESMVRRWKLEPTRRSLGRLAEQAARLSAQLGKADVEVVVEDNGVRLEEEKWRQFWSSLVHAVRNAVDHGIEGSSERASRNKPGQGRITLRTRETAEGLVVEIKDDGRGVSWEKLRERAERAGLPCSTRAELVEVLFQDGVSTCDEVTALSGRGVGMAAVREEARRHGGRVSVVSEPGDGMTLSIQFGKTVGKAA